MQVLPSPDLECLLAWLLVCCRVGSSGGATWQQKAAADADGFLLQDLEVRHANFARLLSQVGKRIVQNMQHPYTRSVVNLDAVELIQFQQERQYTWSVKIFPRPALKRRRGSPGRQKTLN